MNNPRLHLFFSCLVPDYVFEYDVSPTNELEKHYGIDVYDLANGDNITVDQDIDLYLHCYVVLCRINDVGTPCDLVCSQLTDNLSSHSYANLCISEL